MCLWMSSPCDLINRNCNYFFVFLFVCVCVCVKWREEEIIYVRRKLFLLMSDSRAEEKPRQESPWKKRQLKELLTVRTLQVGSSNHSHYFQLILVWNIFFFTWISVSVWIFFFFYLAKSSWAAVVNATLVELTFFDLLEFTWLPLWYENLLFPSSSS